jgi:hypothetical protein
VRVLPRLAIRGGIRAHGSAPRVTACYLHVGRVMEQATSRPNGVVVVAILMGWSGVLTIASIIPPLAPVGLPRWAVALDIVLGIAMLIVAWGLFTLRLWAYIVTLGIQAVNGLFAIVTVVAAPRAWPAWIAIFMAAVIIGYLSRPHVREAFGALRTT